MNSRFSPPFVFGIQDSDGIGTCIVLLVVGWVGVSRALACHVCLRTPVPRGFHWGLELIRETLVDLFLDLHTRINTDAIQVEEWKDVLEQLGPRSVADE